MAPQATVLRITVDRAQPPGCKGRRQNVPDGGVKVYQSG
jgi:hypothetical protein